MPVIGRDSSADIVVPLPQVSARHALIEPVGSGRYRVRDLGSANGTFVGRTRVTETIVDFGSDLRLGSVAFDWNSHAARLGAPAPGAEGLVLGREPDCDLVVADPRVSARHLRVVPRGSVLDISDLGSSNGVFVNGRRVSSAAVGPADEIRLGSLPIDLFAIVAAQRKVPQGPPPPEAPSTARAPIVPATPQAPQAPLAPTGPQAPTPLAASPAPPTSSPAQPKSGSGALWAAAAVLVLALGGAGIVFGTQETVTKSCESCSKSVFNRRAFIWQRADLERQAAAIRWCGPCAEAPVPYRIVVKCRLCGAPYSEQLMTAPRKDQPKDVEQREGFCSPRCQNEQLARDAASGAKKAADDFANGTRNLIQDLFKR